MQKGRTGPDPVSCQSCRSKKLKCNRIQPCSNCTARGITCSFVIPPQKVKSSSRSNLISDEVLKRVQRLESLVLHPSTISVLSEDAGILIPTAASNPNGYGVRKDIDSSLNRDVEQEWDHLESVGTREDSILARLSGGLTFVTRSVNEILNPGNETQNLPNSVGNGRLDTTTVVFPVYSTATLLMQSYEAHVDHICRILHVPTVRSLMKNFYLRIAEPEHLRPGQAALLLSIFAIAAFFYQPFDQSEVAATEADTINLTKYLTKEAWDVLDHSRRSTSGTLEDVQASILMSLVIYHLDGFSARARFMSASAASIARDLRLHRLDADNDAPLRQMPSARMLVEREVKRRVFWYIASTEWLMSTISGPQEGTYFIQPNHVNVRLPKDCSDDEILFEEKENSSMGPQPTGMTIFLERIRLAHLCREIADTVPLETSKLLELPYEKIIALDGKMVDYILSLPFFFQLDPENRERTMAIENIYPIVPVLRYCIVTTVHSRRCKLHQRFLLRQTLDTRYEYSRHACLESARAVIQVYEDISQFHSPSTLMARMSKAVHITHLALAVLIMDLCFNRDKVDDAEIKEAVRTTLQRFEETRESSPLFARFLSSSNNILQKYKVNLGETSLDTFPGTAFSSQGTDEPILDPSIPSPYIEHPGISFDSSLDDFWYMALQDEPDLDTVAWDSLFSELDSRPV